MVFDLGGGTLDVSILMIENGFFAVKSTSGDTHLGGEDFDNKIYEFCLKEFTKKAKLNKEKIDSLLKNQKIRGRLKKESEIAKKALSSSNQVSITIDNFFDGEDLNVNITRNKFESLCEEYFNKCLNPINIALKDAGLTKQITNVVLIGGSTRIPKIRQILKDYFGKEPKSDINPDEAVAFGAALQGGILSVDDDLMSSLILVDVTPLSLGIETAGGVMTKLINKCTSIPVEKEEIFSTYSDNQPKVTIKIYEGERAMCVDNNLLGKFELLNIPMAPRGVPKIKVKFAVDVNGILNVTATEETENKSNSISITNTSRLTKDQLESMYKMAEQFANSDKEKFEKIEAKNKLENYIHNIKNTTTSNELKLKIGEDNYKELQQYVTFYLQWLEENQELTKEEYENKYKEIQELILPIFKNSYETK